MLTRKQAKAIQNFHWQLSYATSNKQTQWLLYILLVIGRQPLYSEAGFVLPTVTMVSLVVVLSTTALLMRSFDRSRNASNVRVSQAVLNAATPALDRARAKLDFLLAGNDPTLPRGILSDRNLYNSLNSNRYTFGDETRLKIVHDIDGNGIVQTQPGASYVLENDETLTSVWKFAVDTDNNGKFDSYTLYSIYFRSPTRAQTTGLFNRARNPLEARTPPMNGTIGGQCQNVTQTSASLIGDSSWYKTGARLTKSFFVYTTTVPITNLANVIPAQGQTIAQYEQYKGNKGFSALEFQQDRSRIPLINNAALFQDDLEITPSANFRLNGRVFTNANLLIGGRGGATVSLYQVSSKDSCFYNEENSKVTVGGNVGTGNAYDTADRTAVNVDLFNGFGNSPRSATINSSNRSTNSPGGSQVAYNDVGFKRRIALMKQAALSKHAGFNSTTGIIYPPPTVISVLAVSDYPTEVKEGFKTKLEAPGGSSLNTQDVLREQIEIYLKDRSIRVPYARVSDIVAAFSSIAGFTFSAGIEPPAEWRKPTEVNTNLILDTANLRQILPEKQRNDGVETYLGDRINVGNNLPAYWKNDAGTYVTGTREIQFLGTDINWTAPNTQPRYRTTQAIALPDVGESNRNGFWEDAAAQKPINNLSGVGGLRAIAGAGIYVDDDSTTVDTPSYQRSTYSFLPPPTWDSIVTDPTLLPKFTTALISSNNDNIIVWSDSMPMTGGADEIAGANRKGDLQMRATAVYHYRSAAYTDSNYINRTPTACVSSYYDPTNSSTARNPLGLPDVSGVVSGTQPAVGVGRSNNGVVYPAPYNSDADRVTAVNTFRTKLNRQAQLVFPNGRIVNQPLRNALQKIDAAGIRSLADNSALDTAICALKILDEPTFLPSLTTALPHGAIKETSFLDAREVKAIDKTATNYDLELEQRQPLEVRVTDINMGVLAATNLGGTPTEFLLPNSGIIYASRDDALPDLSNTTTEKELLSPIDFILDSTRHAHGIRLTNGSNLSRDDNYRQEEKGLIFVTNLPAYIRGNFNLHYQSGTTTATEEFTDTLESDWGDFYTRVSTRNNQFACRKLQPGCGDTGDRWRLAIIISDAITPQTNNFTDGFRDRGDYDLRNNAGSSVTTTRKHKGFWDNSFITSANWAGADGYPSSRNSYQTNGVTPIQRRANAFPAYIMEVCRVVPVSECKPQDWVVGFDFNGNGDLNDSVNFDVNGDGLTNINDKEIGIKAWELGKALATAVPAQTLDPVRLGAGTTARVALLERDRRYARRVAFARNHFNSLILTQIDTGVNAKETAKPLGVGCPLDATGATPQANGCQYPDSATRTPGTHYGTIANNALWFRTTDNITGEPDLVANVTYAADRPLYYLSHAQGGNKLMLPPTPEIAGVASLNLPASNPASGYTICTDSQGSSALYTISQTVTLEMGDCDDQPGNPLAQITAAIDNLIALAPGVSSTDTIVTPTQTGTFTAGTTTTLTQTGRVNVVTIGNLPTSTLAYTTIKLVGNENSIFVLRKSGGIDFGGGSSHYGVSLELNGVEPNNVFWVTDGNMKWNAVNPATPHRLAGTFLNRGTDPKWETLILNGARILGVNVVPSASNYTSDTRIYAMSSNGQPSLVPVLQIHSPEGVPSASTNLDRGGAEMKDKWLQLAGDNLTINAVFVSGNSPSRPAEDSAGLHDFLRLQQNWNGRTINVKGGFIQFKRSAYATAPFTSILAANTSLNDGSLSIFGYPFTKYNAGGIPSGTLPYYTAATRQWGFDVGILAQSPDLFGQRFAQSPTTPADEFFREVSRDDVWVQRLLCAAQKSDPTINRYDHYAIDTSEHPTTNCPAFASYNN